MPLSYAEGLGALYSICNGELNKTGMLNQPLSVSFNKQVQKNIPFVHSEKLILA